MKHQRLRIIGAITLFVLSAACGDEPTTQDAALTSEQRGALHYADQCAACHGEDGRGTDNFPSLTAPHIAAQSDGKLFMLISSGTGGQMPAFGDTMTTDAIIDVIAFVRSIADERP